MPLTVLSSSSDHSDRSQPGTPGRAASATMVLSPQRASQSPARRVLSDVEAAVNQEDFSSLSEQAWDPFLENKYLSENYSEDLDTEAAKKFLEYGDDYRRYIDSDGGSSFFGIPKSKSQCRRREMSGSVSDRSMQSNRQAAHRALTYRSTFTNGAFILASRDPTRHKENNDKLDNKSTKSNDVGINQVSEKNCSPISPHNTVDPASNCVAPNSGVDADRNGATDRLSDASERRATRKHRLVVQPVSHNDSDSDIEDLVELLEHSKAQVLVAESVLSKHTPEKAAALFVDYVSYYQ